MAQFYTLEEAAGRLSLAPGEFRRRLQVEWKDIRPFRDGATLRFRASDIDELARSLGEMSDPSLQLPALNLDPDAPAAPAPPASATEQLRIELEDAPTKEQAILPEPPPSSRRIARPILPAKPTDSDLRVESARAGAAGDDDDSALTFGTEEMDVDLSGPGSAIAKLGPKTTINKTPNLAGPPSVKIPSPVKASAADQSSEFDLSLDADSDSFELQLGTDSAEFNLQPPAPSGPAAPINLAADVPARAASSGIQLGKPADSGLSLERGGPLSDAKSGMIPKSGVGRTGMSDVSGGEFELSLDGPVSQGGSSAAAASDQSEFELTLDDDFANNSDDGPKTGVLDADAQGDIFETDFDLPALDTSDESGSEVVAVDMTGSELALDTSDVIADDESASQVVLVDDDEIAEVEPADTEVEPVLQEDPSASGAMRKLRDDDEDDDDDGETYPSGAGMVAAPAPWGPLPAVVLFLSLPLVFLGGLMSFELLRGMWGYHQPSKPGNMLVRGVADALGMKVSD